METFNTIVSIASGSSVIIALIVTLVKPIRERITHSKERREEAAQQFKMINDAIEGVGRKLEEVNSKVDMNEAKRARAQILRFADEIYQNQLHSKEHFDEILSVCKLYNEYCETHPHFENMRTMAAQKRIHQVYEKCTTERSFLE